MSAVTTADVKGDVFEVPVSEPDGERVVEADRLQQVDAEASGICLLNSELFKTDHMISLYKSLPKVDQLKVIELI